MSFYVVPPDPKCDFCSARPPVMVYPCEDYMFVAVSEDNVIEQPSEGPWLACQLCTSLIEQQDWLTLAVRMVQAQGPGMPEDSQVARVMIEFMGAWIQGFRDHRHGDPDPLV